jgi:O-methyltransferase
VRATPPADPRRSRVWLSLLKKTLIRLPLSPVDRACLSTLDGHVDPVAREIRRWASNGRRQAAGRSGLRVFGRDWPGDAETMIGLVRLNNLHACAVDVIRRRIAGDFLEAGVWRGGACMFLRALLTEQRDAARKVWLADSFQGLPPPEHPMDAGSTFHMVPQLAASIDDVRKRFARYGLLDGRVRFLKGWFRDTLNAGPPGPLAILRLDGDMYDSTLTALRALYDRVSAGGYVIVDDYASIPACRQAVHAFRAERGIVDQIVSIDWTGVFWRVERSVRRPLSA